MSTQASPQIEQAAQLGLLSSTRPASSPLASSTPLPSPPLPAGSIPPPSPGGSSSNRFGLSLNFMQRRPRGSTNPNGMSRPSFGGSGRSPANSPGTELPPSTSPGASTERTGYGFPALRRTLSKRANTADSSATRRMRSRSTSLGPANDNSASAGSSSEAIVPAIAPTASAQSSATPSSSNVNGPVNAETATSSAPDRPKYRIRLVPHLESSRSLHFEPVDRELTGFTVLKVGRFTDRSQTHAPDPLKIAFKSKVVSRGHAEIWVDDHGKWFIKDTKSSSGTFLNHIRLSGPGIESRPFAIKDGDVLQLGVDYQGGTEEIYRCVKIKVELNRGWQRGMNSFNTAALAQLRALGGPGITPPVPTDATSVPASKVATPATKTKPLPAASGTSVTDCCICLYPVTVCQALFIAPCSHVTHFKCIRPLVNQNYPGFSCPLCRTYADLEADVEIEAWEPEEDQPSAAPPVVQEEPEQLETVPEATTADSSAVMGEDATRTIPPTGSAASSRPVSIAMPTHGPNTIAHDALADAATPPNSTFLSTLADSSFARFRDKGTAHISLDHAITSAAGIPTAGPSRNSSSEEEIFEEIRDDEHDSGTGVSDEPDAVLASNPQAKGKGRANSLEASNEQKVESSTTTETT